MKIRLISVAAVLVLGATGASAGAQKDGRRAALEQEFRAKSEQLVRERLNLNDEQMRRLREVNAHLDGRRSALVQQERAARVALRQEMARGGSADQAKVSQLMKEAHDLQQQRFELQQDEQRELSAFLTPVQIAQYVGLQSQLRERMREMRGQQDSSTNP